MDAHDWYAEAEQLMVEEFGFGLDTCVMQPDGYWLAQCDPCDWVAHVKTTLEENPFDEGYRE